MKEINLDEYNKENDLEILQINEKIKLLEEEQRLLDNKINDNNNEIEILLINEKIKQLE